jgi:hypothetical protein
MKFSLTKEDIDLLVKCFWVVSPFMLVWGILAIYRTTVSSAVTVPILGGVSHSLTIIVSIPVLTACVLVLSTIVVLHARFAPGPDLSKRILPIFGAVSARFRQVAVVVICVFLVFGTFSTVDLCWKMAQMQIIVDDSLGHDTVSGIQIFNFREKRDWRWRDPKDAKERVNAYPGSQPWGYTVLAVSAAISVALAFHALFIYRTKDGYETVPAEP